MKWKLLAAGCAAALISQSTLAATVDGDVFSRVTTRAYSEAVIPSTQVDAIVQAGFSAPSALNQRALEFVVQPRAAKWKSSTKSCRNSAR